MARSISAKAQRYVLPGVWEAQRSVHLALIERGDPRAQHDFAPRLTEAERAEMNVSPGSGPSAARAALARMDAQGWFESGPPTPRQYPDAARIPWLADRSVHRVRIYRDDHIEPVPE
jgi:hypothetical protein